MLLKKSELIEAFLPKISTKKHTQKPASKSNSPDESHYVNDKIPPHQHTSSC